MRRSIERSVLLISLFTLMASGAAAQTPRPVNKDVLVNGSYSFIAHGHISEVLASGIHTAVMSGVFACDGNGHVTSGSGNLSIDDRLDQAFQIQDSSSVYHVNANGYGSMTVNIMTKFGPGHITFFIGLTNFGDGLYLHANLIQYQGTDTMFTGIAMSGEATRQ